MFRKYRVFISFVNEEVSVSKLKDVEIEDLLGRDPIAWILKKF